MVNNESETNEPNDVELTNEVTELAAEEPEVEEIESLEVNKLQSLKAKIKRLDEEKRSALEQLALAKAEFLNARKRLEREKSEAIIRQKTVAAAALLPLCDSFQMAMSDPAWEKADASWRKGIEGINQQLQQILSQYRVTPLSPEGETFDPSQHEAIGTEPVNDTAAVDKVISVVQRGYQITHDNTTELIRPARVTTGVVAE